MQLTATNVFHKALPRFVHLFPEVKLKCNIACVQHPDRLIQVG